MFDVLGKTFRYVLNINTIWGLMILISFVAFIVQHFTPTTSWTSVQYWTVGENQVELRVTDREGAVFSEKFLVRFDGENLHIPPGIEAPDRDSSQPWLIGSATKLGTPGLIWDSHAYGNYEVFVNGVSAREGKLVNLKTFTDAAFNYSKTAFNLGLGLVSTFVLFLGLMKVGEDAGLVQIMAYILRPIINFLFPGIPKNHPANGAIVMNLATGILGLGNAATPFGLKAMEEMQKINPRKDTATDAMCMLMGYNTAGFALLPTTMLAIRKSAGCSDPYAIIGTCMIAGASATITAMLMVKLLAKVPFFKPNYTEEEMASIAEEVQAHE